MSEPLEELRAQRALIQQHLDWLDLQIEASKRPQDSSQSDEEPSAPDKTPPPQKITKESVVVSAPPVSGSALSIKPNSAKTSIFDIESAHSNTGSDIKKAQIGCLVFFIIAALGFLFLLFGLPYLID